MKHMTLVAVMLVIVITTFFIGCDQQVQFYKDSGTLEIVFESAISKNTLEPTISMEVASYSIQGKGPGENIFGPIETDGKSPVKIEDLYKGEWTVTIVGLNEAGIAIGEGVENVIILPRKKASTHIQITEYLGDGIFELTVNWPTEDIVDPQILAILTSTTNESLEPKTLTFGEILASSGNATSTSAIPMGYYKLMVTLFDGSTESIENALHSVPAAVRIVDNKTNVADTTLKTTKGTVTFSKDYLNLYGQLIASVENGILAPFTVSLSPNILTLATGETTTILATPSAGGSYTYGWYINGELQEGTDKVLTIPDTLLLGKHSVVVIASRNGMLASASAIIEIQENPNVPPIPHTSGIAIAGNSVLTIPEYLQRYTDVEFVSKKSYELSSFNLVSDIRLISDEYIPNRYSSHSSILRLQDFSNESQYTNLISGEIVRSSYPENLYNMNYKSVYFQINAHAKTIIPDFGEDDYGKTSFSWTDIKPFYSTSSTTQHIICSTLVEEPFVKWLGGIKSVNFDTLDTVLEYSQRQVDDGNSNPRVLEDFRDWAWNAPINQEFFDEVTDLDVSEEPHSGEAWLFMPLSQSIDLTDISKVAFSIKLNTNNIFEVFTDGSGANYYLLGSSKNFETNAGEQFYGPLPLKIIYEESESGFYVSPVPSL